VRVCVCVCIYVCMYVCTCVNVFVCLLVIAFFFVKEQPNGRKQTNKSASRCYVELVIRKRTENKKQRRTITKHTRTRTHTCFLHVQRGTKEAKKRPSSSFWAVVSLKQRRSHSQLDEKKGGEGKQPTQTPYVLASRQRQREKQRKGCE
jgi:hypothetical protein